ncbi:MAG: NAD(+)/NADH kinase [Spirochaetaceae bacterium]
MKVEVKKVLLIANAEKDDAMEVTGDVRSYLENQGVEVVTFAFRGKPAQPVLEDYDLAISLGGDGTVLFSSRILYSHSIPILPVNLGNFGFITEVTREEWVGAFECYRSGMIEARDRLLIKVGVHRDGSRIGEFVGLNDTVISAYGISKIVKLSVWISGEFLGHYRADGIIVATPTGSTAYSAAAGGPILHPEMQAIILNPICPFTLSHRPLVMSGQETVVIEVEPEQRTGVIMTVDGQSDIPLVPGDRIVVSANEEAARIVQSSKRTFYEVLRTKLNWSGGHSA